MKVWFVYYLGDLEEISLSYDHNSQDYYRLYGITNSKELLKSFMCIRKPDLFKIVRKDILPSEYSEIANEYRGSVIDNYNLLTRSNDGVSKDSVTLTITFNEYQISTDEDVIEYMLYDESIWKNALTPNKYNNKLKKALYTLQYIQCWALATQKSLDEFDEYDAPDFSIDEFHSFISNFGHTLK